MAYSNPGMIIVESLLIPLVRSHSCDTQVRDDPRAHERLREPAAADHPEREVLDDLAHIMRHADVLEE
jgi:hypothetical protein